MHPLRSILVLSAALVSLPAAAGDDLSLDALLGMKVTTASKKAERLEDAPGVMTVITREQINEYGRRDLFEVLELVVGSYEAQNFLYPRNFTGLRGEDSFRANHVLYLLNGRPMRRSLDGGYIFPILKTLPVDAVDRIEVIRGPGSVLYGSTAYQGVVNIITRTPDGPEAQVTAGYGTYDSWRGQLTGGLSHDSGLTVLAGVSGVKSDGYRVEQVDSENEPGAFNRYANDVGGTLQVGFKGFRLNAAASTGDSTSFGANAVWDNNDPWINRRAMVDAGWGHDVTDWLSVQTNFTWNYALQSNADASFVAQASDLLEDGSSTTKSNDYLAEASAYITPHDRVNLLVGASLERQTGYWLIGDPDRPGVNTGYLPPYGEEWGAVFFQSDYRPVDNIKLVMGAQANKAGDVPWDVVPRLGVVAHANDHFGVKVLTGQAFRASYHFERNFKVNDILLPNPNLAPEKITTLDTQAFVTFGSFKGSVNVFQSEQANLIDFGSVDGTAVQQNMSGTRVSRGIEVEARGKPVIGLETFGSLSVVRFWQVDGEAPELARGLTVPVPVRWGVTQDDRATAAPPSVILKGGASYQHHRGIGGSVFGTWQTPSDYTRGKTNDDLTQQGLEGWDKPFFDLDARVQADLAKLSGATDHPIKIGLNARNLLGQRRYADWGDGLWQMHSGREVMLDVQVGL